MGKNLSEMSNDELWQLFPIILKPHNPLYSSWYQEEKRHLNQLINRTDIIRINHIGSTAVHGLLAKPTVDILIEVKNQEEIQRINDIMSHHQEYIVLNQKDGFQNPCLLCMKGYTEQGFLEKVFHIHIRVHNNHKELYFRDYLRENKKVADDYGQLKIQLMKKYKHHRDHYTDAKSKFIDQYTKLAKTIYPNRYKPNPK